MRLNTESAIGAVPATPALLFLGLMGIIKTVIGARLTGVYRLNPFFSGAAHEPVHAPRVLTSVERAQFSQT